MADFKYEYVVDIVKEKILYGEYKPGGRLPSIQAFAKELSLNTDTIIRAYKLLETEHLIYSVAKSGYFVVKSTNTDEKERGVIDMLTSTPAHEVNPYKDFYHCMEKAILLYEHKLYTNSPVRGMPELIGILKKYMTNYQIFTKEQDIFITCGAQQALFILSSMDFPNGGDTILVEQPTYHVMLETVHANKTPVIGIKRTAEGLDLSELEKIFSQNKIKFFYLMPRFQNPTGFSYSNKQKKEILKLARKHNVYIVEDDYLPDLEIDPKNDPFVSFDEDSLVVYVRSFSKTLLPGLRLGMAVIPEPLQDEFIKRKGTIDLSSSVFSQGALEIYLRSSMYKSHIKRTKAFYEKKMDTLRKACDQYLSEPVNYWIPPTGIYASIGTGNTSSVLAAEKMADNGVTVMSTNPSYIGGFVYSEGIRLCTCKADTQDIIHAIQILGRILLPRKIK